MLFTEEGNGSVKSAATRADLLRAPTEPGYFEVRQGEEVLLAGAAHFGDSRESDLREAASVDEVFGERAAAVARNTREDHLWRYWVLILLVVMLLVWYFSGRSRETGGEPVKI